MKSSDYGLPTREDMRLAKEIESHIKGVGEVIYAEYRGPDWSALVDTEFAALRVYYAYRGSVRIEKAGGRMGGWLISRPYKS